MRFKSFIKLPAYKRFSFEPRYYDPIKEEVEKRERLIKGSFRKNDTEGTKNRISDAFQSRQRENKKPVFIQAFIAIILLVVTVIALANIDKWL